MNETNGTDRDKYAELIELLNEEDLLRLCKRAQMQGNDWLADTLCIELILKDQAAKRLRAEVR